MSTSFYEKSHAEKILQELWQQRENEQLCDVEVIAGAEEIKITAHRCILSAASGYFKGMFSSLRESKSKQVKIPSVHGETLNSLIEYCYTGRVDINDDVVEKLLQTANMLLLSNVADACSVFLAEQLHPTNCLGFMFLAERHNCQFLFKRAKEYSSQHFVEVCDTEEFLTLNAEQLGQLLVRDDLCVLNEELIFKSFIKWIDHRKTERVKHIGDLIKLVRLNQLQPEFLIDNVKPICTSPQCIRLYFEAMEWHVLPKRRKLVSSELSKPRGTSCKYLMGITHSVNRKKMFLHYYCPQRLMWMKWVKHLDYRKEFGLAIQEHQIYIIGGLDSVGRTLNSIICLNMKTMTLTKVEPMLEQRVKCGAAFLNGYLYVAGGVNCLGGEFLSSVERFDPKTNTWKNVASMSVGRFRCRLVGLNDKLYVFGSNNDTSGEYYDPQKNVWTSIARMGLGRTFLKVVAANGLLYALGESNKTFERYDTVANRWTTLSSLPLPLKKANLCTAFEDKVVVLFNDHVYVYNATTDEWKADASLKGLPSIYYAFSYSNQILMSEFTED